MPADARLEDLASFADYAARVTRRLARPAQLAVERALTSAHFRGSSPAAWFVARAEASFRALESAARRSQPADFPTPWQINTAQMHCQKPFQLWNVTRDEWKEPIAFERGLRFVLGRAASEHGPTPEGRPGTVEPASEVARAADRERDEVHESAWGSRKSLFSLLAQPPQTRS